MALEAEGAHLAAFAAAAQELYGRMLRLHDNIAAQHLAQNLRDVPASTTRGAALLADPASISPLTRSYAFSPHTANFCERLTPRAPRWALLEPACPELADPHAAPQFHTTATRMSSRSLYPNNWGTWP